MFLSFANTETVCRRSLLLPLLLRITTLTVSVVISIAVAVVYSQSVYADDASRPNIILIMADDMGWSDIGCYGGEIETPTLNRLAEGGLRFTQFYNTGRCCPTRASLMSGLYPHQAGVGWMMTDRGHDGYRGEINRRCVTIAEALKPAGYSTYMTGKWHITKATQPEGPKDNWPLQRGFDRFYGTITGAGSFFDPGTLTRDNTMISPFADPEYQPKQFYYTNAISDHAVRFIDDHLKRPQQKPFFMYVAYTAAHWPMHALPEDIAKYNGKYDGGYGPIRKARMKKLKELGLWNEQWEAAPQVGDWNSIEHKEWESACMEVYAAMVDRMDQGIEKIVQALKKHDQFENTLILFLQDNGGCQEGNGRRGNFKRPVKATLPRITDDVIRLAVVPKQNRAGVPTLTGPNIMPGPEDTYIAYGINWANTSNTPFREYKHFVHEGGISTPLIAHWPKGITEELRGKLEHQPSHLIDIMATCVDLSRANYPKTKADHKGWMQNIQPMEGVSLAPAFQGKSLKRKEPLFWEHEGNRAIREGDWKLVAKENRDWELYRVPDDRPEQNNLASKHPDVVKDLSAKWEVWAKRANVLPLGTWRRNRKKPKQKKYNKKQTRFELRNKANLDEEQAPYVKGRSIQIQIELQKTKGDGVLIAHGGYTHGYAVYLKGGKLHFAVRRKGKLTRIVSKELLPSETSLITAKYDQSGNLSLTSFKKEFARGKVDGAMLETPIDGLSVGYDRGDPVSNYQGPFPYEGTIKAVVLQVSEK